MWVFLIYLQLMLFPKQYITSIYFSYRFLDVFILSWHVVFMATTCCPQAHHKVGCGFLLPSLLCLGTYFCSFQKGDGKKMLSFSFSKELTETLKLSLCLQIELSKGGSLEIKCENGKVIALVKQLYKPFNNTSLGSLDLSCKDFSKVRVNFFFCFVSVAWGDFYLSFLFLGGSSFFFLPIRVILYNSHVSKFLKSIFFLQPVFYN